jgi:hypothetical protein
MNIYLKMYLGLLVVIFIITMASIVYVINGKESLLTKDLAAANQYIHFLEGRECPPANKTIRISDYQLDFIAPGPDGRETVVATLAWGGGVVRLSGSMDSAAKGMMTMVGDRKAKEQIKK